MFGTFSIPPQLGRPRRRARLLAGLCSGLLGLLLPGSGLLHADEIRLTNGGVLEGNVIENGDTVVIELAGGGRVALRRAQVASITESATPTEQLAEKEAALPAGDGLALARLARWCDEKGLDRDRDRLYWRVLEVLPNHAKARETLGFRKLGALWLTEEDYQHHLGNVLHDGKWIPVDEWERIQIEESDAIERATVEDALETAARRSTRPDDAAAALEEFRAAPESLRRLVLARTLKSHHARRRQLAVRLTGELDGHRPQQSLTHVAVHDGRKSVRDEALRVLQDWGDPDVALGFVPYLSSNESRERINAVRALNVFPDRRAVGAMIETTEIVWAGFGRVHFAQIVQRAYVKDYELVSGGTGQVVSEVADPIVDTILEGVVLDIDVRRAEAISRIATLERMTGQRFGSDFGAWAKWWKEEQGAGATSADRSAPETGGARASEE